MLTNKGETYKKRKAHSERNYITSHIIISFRYFRPNPFQKIIINVNIIN